MARSGPRHRGSHPGSAGDWDETARDELAALLSDPLVVAVGEIGSSIENTITAAGFQPVRNLTGHGLARWKVHTPPQIPNYAEHGGGRLRAGMVFAIEPFACTGRGFIRERGRADLAERIRTRPPA